MKVKVGCNLSNEKFETIMEFVVAGLGFLCGMCLALKCNALRNLKNVQRLSTLAKRGPIQVDQSMERD